MRNYFLSLVVIEITYYEEDITMGDWFWSFHIARDAVHTASYICAIYSQTSEQHAFTVAKCLSK